MCWACRQPPLPLDDASRRAPSLTHSLAHQLAPGADGDVPSDLAVAGAAALAHQRRQPHVGGGRQACRLTRCSAAGEGAGTAVTVQRIRRGEAAAGRRGSWAGLSLHNRLAVHWPGMLSKPPTQKSGEACVGKGRARQADRTAGGRAGPARQAAQCQAPPSRHSSCEAARCKAAPQGRSRAPAHLLGRASARTAGRQGEERRQWGSARRPAPRASGRRLQPAGGRLSAAQAPLQASPDAAPGQELIETSKPASKAQPLLALSTPSSVDTRPAAACWRHHSSTYRSCRPSAAASSPAVQGPCASRPAYRPILQGARWGGGRQTRRGQARAVGGRLAVGGWPA